MPTSRRVEVVLLAAGAQHQVAARDDLDGHESVRYCETADRLIQLVEEATPDVVVSELRDAVGNAVAPAVAVLHDRRPNLPIIAHFIASPTTLHDVPTALAAGVSETAVRGHDHLGKAVRIAWRRRWHSGAQRLLLDSFRKLLPANLLEFAIACAIAAAPRLTGKKLSSWLRGSERTLRAQLQQAGLHPPSYFIEFGTVVHATYLLDRLGLEPHDVAENLGFADRRSLNRLLRRYVGKNARDFRRHDDFASVLRSAELFLRRPPAQNVLNLGVSVDIIDRYLAGDLDAQEHLVLDQKLATNPEAGEYLAEMRRLLSHADATQIDRYKGEVWAMLQKEMGQRARLIAVVGTAPLIGQIMAVM